MKNLVFTIIAGLFLAFSLSGSVSAGSVGNVDFRCNLPYTGRYGTCSTNTNWNGVSGQCIAVHRCPGRTSFGGGDCIETNPLVYNAPRTINAGDIADQLCSYVQIDVLPGGVWSNCSTGHGSHIGAAHGMPTNCGSTTGTPPIIIITPSPPPPICNPCSSYNNCQSSTPPSKWRQQAQNFSGSWQTCNNNGQSCPDQNACNCPSSSGGCNWTHYYNSAPSCSISLDRTSVSRQDAPINMTLVVNDADYGDTVEITNYRVENHCALIRTTGGTSLSNGIVVKPGTGEGNEVTGWATNFIVNQQLAHGVFTGNPSLCQARVVIEIRDRIGDAGDTQSTATCSANFTVRNEAPQLGAVEMYDRDPVSSLRRAGNQVNGSPTVWLSSQDFAQRPQQCTTAVDINGNPTTTCATQTPIVTKTNPFEFFFTVSDANGSNDINYAGIWLQRNDLPGGGNAPIYPVTASSSRRSFTAMYSDYSDRFIANGFHWITRADHNANLATGTNRLSGMRLGGGGSGNSSSSFRTSLYRGWQSVGFPDCLETSYGCQTSNVPAVSQGVFNGTSGTADAYLWDVVATSNNYICYDNSMHPRVSSGCDNSCAACVRRAQTNPVQQLNATTIRFGFEIQINEPLLEGRYAVLLMADDKVGVSLNAGPQWASFTRNGAYCTNCGANQFALGVDKSYPTYTTRFREGIGDEIYADVANIADNLSGYAGLYRIVYYKQDPTGVRTFLTNANGTCQFNGQQNCYTGPTPQSGFTFLGYGVRGADVVRAFVCLYDVAGNGGCRPDDMNPPFVAQDNWMKTSMGTVYSNLNINSNTAFQVQVPSNPPNVDITNTLAADLLYAPYNNQQNTILSGAYITAATSPGVTGGNSNRQGGVNNNYRALNANNHFNVTGIIDNVGTRYGNSGWYARTLSLANYNCPILKQRGTTLSSGFNSECHEFTGGTLATLDQMENTQVKNKIITLNLPSGSRTRTTKDYNCSNNNLIFIASGHLEWVRQLRKNTANVTPDACIFIVAAGATLTIGDEPDNQYAPDVDRFHAGVIADGSFVTELGARGSNGKFDQLQIHGFVFSARTAPRFERDLIFSVNKQLPSELLVYDPVVIDSMRPLLGTSQYSEFRCGTSSHPVCTD